MQDNQCTLWGPNDVTQAKLLEVLQNSLPWVFCFHGIKEVSQAKGFAGDNLLEITLSSWEKVDELVTLCNFIGNNEKYPGFDFSCLGKHDKCWLRGAPGSSYPDLLNALQNALAPNITNASIKPFEYTLTQLK